MIWQLSTMRLCDYPPPKLKRGQVVKRKGKHMSIYSIYTSGTIDCEAVAKWKDNVAYAASKDYNALFKMNLINGECSYIGMFPNEKTDRKRLYTAAVKCCNKIYFVPSAADEIGVYEPDTKHLYKLEIKSINTSENVSYKMRTKFSGGLAVGKYVYMTPCTYPGLIRIDSEDDTIEYYDEWIGDGNFVFRKSPLLTDEKIYLPSVTNNKILIFDTSALEGRIVSLPTANYGWWSMLKVEDDFILAPQVPGPVIRWNEQKNCVREYNNYPDNFIGNNKYFTKIFESDNKLCLLPDKANMGVMLKCCNQSFAIEAWNICETSKDSTVGFMFQIGEFLYLKIQEKENTSYIRLNMDDLTVKEFRLILKEGKERLLKEYRDRLADDIGILKGNKNFVLRESLKRI